MRNLLERVKADNRRILTTGISTDITLMNRASGETQTVRGFYIDVDHDIDPQTGASVRVRKTAVHVHRADITIGTPQEGSWKASFVNQAGETVTGIVIEPSADRTTGYVSMFLEAYDEEAANG